MDFLNANGYTVDNTVIMKRNKPITSTRLVECIDFWSEEWRTDDNDPQPTRFSKFLFDRNLGAGFLNNIHFPGAQKCMIESWLNCSGSSDVQQNREEEEPLRTLARIAEEEGTETAQGPREHDGAGTATEARIVPAVPAHPPTCPAPLLPTKEPWVALKDHKQMIVFKAMMEATVIPTIVRQNVTRKASNEVLVRFDRYPRHYQYQHPEFSKQLVLHVRRLREPKCKTNKFPNGRVESVVAVAWVFLFQEGVPHDLWPAPRFRV